MKRQLLLYAGLGLLALFFAARWAGAPAGLCWTLFGVAIACKTLFLIRVFSAKGFRAGGWLYFILAGVALMLLSMLFKTPFPAPALQQTLFYAALGLKATGLCLLMVKKKNVNPEEER
jgi:hypothetical protein